MLRRTFDGRAVASYVASMSIAKLVEEQAMALPAEERQALGAKLLVSVGVVSPQHTRRAGSAAGRVHMAHNFDAPLGDFSEYS